MAVRKRHPFGAATRETHSLSNVDFAAPSNRLYGSEMDIEPVTVTDIGAGSITDGAISPDGIHGDNIRPGTLPPTSGDSTPPALPTMVTVTSELVTDANGTSVVAIKVVMLPPTDTDYFSTTIEATDLNDGDPVTPLPVWLRPIVAVSGKESTIVYITGVAGATQYWVRMRTTDTQGNSSIYSSVYPVMTVADTVAPNIPQSVAGASGFKAIGVRWSAGSATDLMFNEVRFARDLNPGVGDAGPDIDFWTTRRTSSNYIYIDSLDPGVWYWAQVRAVDYSRNVAGRWKVSGNATTDVLTCPFHAFANGDKVFLSDHVGAPELELADSLYVVNTAAPDFQVSDTVGGAPIDFTVDLTGFIAPDQSPAPPLAVDYLVEPEAGWSLMVGPLEAALVGASDVAFNSLISNMIATGYIDATTIQTGDLNISTGAGTADGIHVLYGGSTGQEIGLWDETGLYVRSKVTGRTMLDYIHIDDAALTVYKDGTPRSAITPDGINATAINFGVSPGGHNLAYNSSFELSKFVTTSTDLIGVSGDTLLGGVGGWVLVTNTNGVLAATSVTGTFP